MTALRSLAVAWMTLAASACSGAAPCTDCAPLEGSFRLVFEVGASTSCPFTRATAPEGNLDVFRQGSTLSGQLDATPVSGTLYDTGDFRLSGAGRTDDGTWSLELRGRYLPGTGSADGGVGALRGTEATTVAGAGGDTCTFERSFTGQRR